VLYIFFLPFALVDSLGWLVAPVVAIVSFTLFGIEAIGAEIENPCKLKYQKFILKHIPNFCLPIL
jgi:predicted membrane chloride channel (bestrophin family)